MKFTVEHGKPYPFGVSQEGLVTNFALVAPKATLVILCLFDSANGKLVENFFLSPEINKTGGVWHIAFSSFDGKLYDYAYKIEPQLLSKQELLLDPYAKSVRTSHVWGDNNLVPELNNGQYCPLGDVTPSLKAFDWEGDRPPSIPLNKLIIYEAHVRSFTEHPSSQVQHRGTFLGLIEKIPHLLELGINAIELMPIQEFNELEYSMTHHKHPVILYNYWGYSTVNYFSPMNRYATSNQHGASISEFKTMVKALHKNGLEVILDVVFNHTAEGNEKGPIISFKGIDNDLYYILNDDRSYGNYSGCGNTVNANHPVVIAMIIDVLRYWVVEMHVDGFRFDLASALIRDSHGNPMEVAPLIDAITNDPILANIKLISEPWDCGGLYQVGSFADETTRWSEWNGKYRDSIRRFIKGTPYTHNIFSMRICGSQDLYDTRTPCNSINFITAHDGFTLADLVSYNQKHNIANRESNRDGSNDNESWNCGMEGTTTNPIIRRLRARQMRNFHLALMISQGVPMLSMGDEYGHTKFGNNNTWCHDSTLNWFLWDQLSIHHDFFRFYSKLIHFRKQRDLLQKNTFRTPVDIDWHGMTPFHVDWEDPLPFIAFTIKDHQYGKHLYVAFNASGANCNVTIPPPSENKHWRWVVNTANEPPQDIFEDGEGPLLNSITYDMISHSAIVLEL